MESRCIEFYTVVVSCSLHINHRNHRKKYMEGNCVLVNTFLFRDSFKLV